MFNELIKNVMSLGIITEDDVKRLTSIELMLLIIERINGLLLHVNNVDGKLDTLLEDVNKITIEELNKWTQDGTFDSLLNQSALKDVNERIAGTNAQLAKKADKSEIGSPLIASSIEEMTDTTKVYVNTSDGKWYSYDGDKWVIGGIYQSVGITDEAVGYNNLAMDLRDALTLKPTQLVIDDWELGSLQSATGQLVTSDTRIRSYGGSTFTFKGTTATIELSPGYKVSLYYYSDATTISDRFIGTTEWITKSGVIEVNPSYYYRVVLARVDDGIITVDETSNVSIYEIVNLVTNQLNQLSDLLRTPSSILIDKWELGSLQSSTGQLVTSDTRIRSYGGSTFTFKGTKATIELSPGYKVSLYYYSDATVISGKFIGTTGWITKSGEIEVNPGYYYRVTLACVDDGNITVKESSNVSIYEIRNRVESLNESVLKSRKYQCHTPQIVMHRGFTGLRSENTLPAYYMCTEYGVKFAKMDVQETKDNEFIMSHQENLIEPFTNGNGEYIKDLKLSEIKSNYYITGPMYTSVYNQKLRFPTIDEALECCRETGLIPMIDMKTGTSYKKLYDKICRYGLQNTACILTNRKEVLNAFRQLDSDLTLILWDGNCSDKTLNYLINLGGSVGFFTDASNITLDLVEKYHNAGIIFGTYPINDYTEIERVVDCCVDFIQTDQCSRDLKTNFQCKNLAYVIQGNTNYSLELQDNECKLFNDYIDLEVEVYYSSSSTPVTVTIDEKTLVDSAKPGEWHKLRMQRVKKNAGTMTISVTSEDPEFMYVDLIIRRYIRGIAE